MKNSADIFENKDQKANIKWAYRVFSSFEWILISFVWKIFFLLNKEYVSELKLLLIWKLFKLTLTVTQKRKVSTGITQPSSTDLLFQKGWNDSPYWMQQKILGSNPKFFGIWKSYAWKKDIFETKLEITIR